MEKEFNFNQEFLNFGMEVAEKQVYDDEMDTEVGKSYHVEPLNEDPFFLNAKEYRDGWLIECRDVRDKNITIIPEGLKIYFHEEISDKIFDFAFIRYGEEFEILWEHEYENFATRQLIEAYLKKEIAKTLPFIKYCVFHFRESKRIYECSAHFKEKKIYSIVEAIDFGLMINFILNAKVKQILKHNCNNYLDYI